VLINKNPRVAGVNSATLSGAGLGLNWSGPQQWSAKLQVAERVGGVSSVIPDPSAVRVWGEINKAF
jgi:hypothetical protein